MKRLFFRHPLLALAVLAVLFTYNYCEEHKSDKKSATLKVSLDEEQWKICVSKGGERKKRCFDLPAFFPTGDVSLDVQNEEILVHYFNGVVSSIDTKWEFDKASNKLFLKKFIGNFPDRHNIYDGEDVCSLDDANIFIGDIDDDGFVDNMTTCHYEYTNLPPLQKIAEDMIEMAEDGSLYEYSSGENIRRYKGYLRKYPLSDANQVTYNNMGYYLERAEAYGAAIYLLNAVLEKYPQRAVAHLNIADAYWGNHENENAKQHYKEYVRLMKKQEKDMDKIPQRVHNRVENIAFFTDRRDGQQYSMVKIDNQTWMAENLNFQKLDGSWCYCGSQDSCVKYGRLYNWNTAMSVCPKGWHLPTTQEWDILMRTVGSERKQYQEKYGHDFLGWDGAGKTLKAEKGWFDDGNGTDDYGFSALPAGIYSYVDDFAVDVGCCGWWWTATEEDADNAYSRDMNSRNDNVHEGTNHKYDGISIRCVQN